MLWLIQGWDNNGLDHETDIYPFLIESNYEPIPEECELVAERENLIIPGIKYIWTVEPYIEYSIYKI